MGTRRVSAAVVVALFAGSALAGDISAVNSYRMNTRVFNDFPGSALLVDNAGEPNPGMSNDNFPIPGGNVSIDELFSAGEPGNFANKHVAWLSADNGASRFQALNQQSFSITFDVNLTAPGAAPRKEAGIEIRNPRPNNNPPFTDEGQVLIASDGEVAVFGAAMPFHTFGSIYTLGTTAQVSFIYYAPGAVGAMAAYQLLFNDAVTGPHDSGIKVWGNEADGTNGFNTNTEIGFKIQNQRNPTIADESHVLYSGVTIVPTPGALALLGLGGLAAGRRRR